MVDELRDPRRVDPPKVGSERALLESWLEFQRTTLLLKCERLDAAGRTARPVATSKLSLHGLVRHMTDVERNWFSLVLLRDDSFRPHHWGTVPDEPDADLVPLDDADWDADLALWHEECERSREHAAQHDLDHTGLRRGQEVSLRWIYLHMIEEYARHNGHADLLRELVDGAVGD